MSSVCQSCQREPRQIAEACDNTEAPYLLCHACHERLLSRSLRPAEWFNLSKRFGWWQFLLHDDFYDEDGAASQPETEVAAPESFPCPELSDVPHEPESLLDYTATRWSIDDELRAAWCQLDPLEVLQAIETRFAKAPNAGIKSVCLDVAAMATRSIGAGFTTMAWRHYPSDVEVGPLFRATAACLPLEEGFGRACQAVQGLTGRDRRNAMLSLSHFQSTLALRWIEQQADEPTTDEWGNLAAASCISWSDVCAWLARGRPLSLIAIDAMRAIADPKTPLLRAMAPTLLSPPGRT